MADPEMGLLGPSLGEVAPPRGGGGGGSSSSSSSGASTPTALVSVVPAFARDEQPPKQPQQPQHQPQQPRLWRWLLLNYVLIPACLPLITAWWLAALALATAASLAVAPSLVLARRLYWAAPFIPHVWARGEARQRLGWLGAQLLRLQFEGAHCTATLGRLLTLPLRPHLPDFYVLGFPKCGTTSLAHYLKRHPGISGPAGMPGNEVFSKETHYFMGILGRGTTTSAALYRSFFPTVVARWWAEAVRGVPRWMCFDACPTYACLPHVAARAALLTPHARLVVLVRDPAAGMFSAETMLRNCGLPLDWSLSEPLRHGEDGAADLRFQLSADDAAFWAALERLPADAPLPADLPQRFYGALSSYLMAGRYADRLAPWIAAFGAERLLLVDYRDLASDPEATVARVLEFVGAAADMYQFQRQPARMVGDYKGARLDPGVASWLNANWFADSNAAVGRMLAAAGGAKAAAGSWP